MQIAHGAPGACVPVTVSGFGVAPIAERAPAGAGGGVTRYLASAPSSDDSFFLPNTITTWPSGLNLTIMSDPLSTHQMLSSLSTRTTCANDHAYSPLPISRMNLPSGPNSS